MHSNLRGQRPPWLEEARRAGYRLPARRSKSYRVSRSVRMEGWEHLHPLAQGTWNGRSFANPVPSGEMWECPDFFPLGNKHVLLYSTEHTTRWEVGTFDTSDLRFRSERKGILD